MDRIVDLPAVRPARLAARLADDPLPEAGRELRPYLRNAHREDLPRGLRLVLCLEPVEIAGLADVVRQLADEWPFLSFRLLADPPACWLEVEGTGQAAGIARAVFSALAD